MQEKNASRMQNAPETKYFIRNETEEIGRFKRQMVPGCIMSPKGNISFETSGTSKESAQFKRRMVPGCRMP